jgi:hypothetical protein
MLGQTISHSRITDKLGEGDRSVRFLITVRETVPDADRSMQFVAQADKQTNQKTAAFPPDVAMAEAGSREGR